MHEALGYSVKVYDAELQQFPIAPDISLWIKGLFAEFV